MSSDLEKMVLALALKKITREQFIKETKLDPETEPMCFVLLLERAFVSRNSDEVEIFVLAAFMFKNFEIYQDIVRRLLKETWHNQHEQLVDLLAKVVDSDNIDSYENVLLTTYDYYKQGVEDFMVPIWIKCIFALGAIGTDRAKEVLNNYKNSPFQGVQEAFKKQLQ